MITVEAGSFEMGGKKYDQKPIHTVKLASFQLCRYPVTQALWEALTGENPSHFRGPQRPVERVNWYEVVTFCNCLSEQQGLSPCYQIDGEEVSWQQEAKGYRLPTEAEWEYAARGGRYRRGYTYAGSNELDQVA